MSQRFFSFGAVYDRDRGSARGLAEIGATRTQTFSGVSFVAAADGLGGIEALLPLYNVEILRVHVLFRLTVGVALELRSHFGALDWLVTTPLVAGAISLLTNGGLPTIFLGTQLVLGGPFVRQPSIRVGGAVFALVGVGVTTADITVEWRPFGNTDRVSLTRAGYFTDDAILVEGSPTLASLLALEQTFGASGGQAVIGAPVPGESGTIEDCGVALPHPDFTVTVAPADIGNGPQQIPPDLASNSRSHYLYHPSAFFRTTPYVREIVGERDFPTCLQIDEQGIQRRPVTDPNGALTIFRVIRPPTHSRWLISVDSATHDVIVAHPPGSDLRSPKAIWRRVWASALQHNAVGDSVRITRFAYPPVPPFAFNPVGLISRLGFLEYALFVEALDLEAVAGIPITEIVYQEGAVQ